MKVIYMKNSVFVRGKSKKCLVADQLSKHLKADRPISKSVRFFLLQKFRDPIDITICAVISWTPASLNVREADQTALYCWLYWSEGVLAAATTVAAKPLETLFFAMIF